MGARIYLDDTLLGNATDQFLRYTFDISAAIAASANDSDTDKPLSLVVSFDPSIHVDGRFAACTGGWDWAQYSHTFLDGAHTLSKGIWKSVYLAASPPAAAAIMYVVPQIIYRGAYPTSRLVDGAHAGFNVAVRVHLDAAAATRGVLSLRGAWMANGNEVNVTVKLPKGESNTTLTTTASASEVHLWWPVGLGGAPHLYNLTVTFTPAGEDAAATPAASATRTVGFRYIALVTGNDTDSSYVIHAASSEGTSRHGLYVRVNGVPIFSRGANVIPMEEYEGRLSADAHVRMVEAAVGGRFNMLRVWGGGMFLPDAFYDACDQNGVLVYHDMQYAQSGHYPRTTSTQERELRHSIRRLASHASIAIWDGCNECQVVMGTNTAIYATFVMTVVAEEDVSRAVWPSCPALGWTAGVHMLDSTPNGHALTTPYQPFGPYKGRSIETHGPYMHGSGFPTVNGANEEQSFTPYVPTTVSLEPTGLGRTNIFASEFGASVMSSFESMAPTLAPEHWGLHAGQPSDTCGGGFAKKCVGDNVMAERNYPCDNMIDVYFGKQPAGYFNRTGEDVFKRQLYQCMLGQALHMKGDIEARRSQNIIGMLVWQYNEIWPTGGWGSIEYGTPVAGQVLGGRWKPLHYFYSRSLYADVMAACGAGGWCFVKNDRAGEPFVGQVEVAALEFATGKLTVLTTRTLQMPPGPGESVRFQLELNASGGVTASTHMLFATCYELCDGERGEAKPRSETLSVNEILLAPPKDLRLPAASVTVTVAPRALPDGTIDVHVNASATALYVTLTTLAQGRFSDNAFAMSAGVKTIRFLPLGKADPVGLAKSVRVEHLQSHVP